MNFRIQPADELPIYRQILRQVLDGIASGRILPGEKLPSQRELAQRLVVAPLTIKKAYELLERNGTVETRRGHGTFVRADPQMASPAERRLRMRAATRRLVIEAWVSGISLDELIRFLREEDAALSEERHRVEFAKENES